MHISMELILAKFEKRERKFLLENSVSPCHMLDNPFPLCTVCTISFKQIGGGAGRQGEFGLGLGVDIRKRGRRAGLPLCVGYPAPVCINVINEYLNLTLN